MTRLMVTGLAHLLMAGLMITSTTAVARERTPRVIARGAQIGVVNLLNAEVMHYHAAKDSNDSFLKIQAVNWPVDAMLTGALKGQLEELGLTPTALTPTDSLERARESCFVNAALADGLPRNCSAPILEQAASAGVEYLIVLAPGLNNSAHAGSSRSEGVTEAMRGWGFLTRERAGTKDKPNLFNEVELLLIGISPEGATLRARQWGGVYSMQWQTYTLPPDPKAIAPEQLDQLQPLFAAMLSRQVKDLLGQIQVAP
ncbi:MAG: hypothetical protein ACJ8R9_12790 [Steroidobacteraceae bacterium]